MLERVLRLHDRITSVMYLIGAAAILVITFLTAMEVALRYFFAAPTSWSVDTAVIAFAAAIFLAAPELSRLRTHVTMSFLIDQLPPWAHRALARVIDVLGCGISGWVAWACAVEALRLYQGGVAMVTATAWPKWWVVALLAYGMGNISLYFLRHALFGVDAGGAYAENVRSGGAGAGA